MDDITASMQYYIKAVYELSSEGEGARICDIADKVAVTKSSACMAMKSLQKNGLVYRDERRLVFLTDKGERQAVLMLDKVAVIRRFLMEVLGVERNIADADACAMEHVVSVETLCALCQLNHRINGEPRRKRECHVGVCDSP